MLPPASKTMFVSSPQPSLDQRGENNFQDFRAAIGQWPLTYVKQRRPPAASRGAPGVVLEKRTFSFENTPIHYFLGVLRHHAVLQSNEMQNMRERRDREPFRNRRTQNGTRPKSYADKSFRRAFDRHWRAYRLNVHECAVWPRLALGGDTAGSKL
ncbi:hypothetical protein EVAR_8234_1 [Eumeta japonica]|uniref:Uncharacterized protein n=1 Tax=Eumeta variegata TaxID=151549 RepID=A0A4C1TFM3_EUMVA|nr:hypothetical protein EVAR_8234_1 [Eumeta japonica]